MSREVTGDAPRLPASRAILDLDPPDDDEPAPPPLRRPSVPVLVATTLALVLAVAVGCLVVGSTPVPAPTTAPTPSPSTPDLPPPLRAAAAAAALPLDIGLTASVVADGRESGDYTHVKARVSVLNRGGVARRIASVGLVGLGTARVEPLPPGTLAPGDTVALGAEIDVDCAVRTDGGAVFVTVTEIDARGERGDLRVNTFSKDTDPRSVLDPLCPKYRPGLRVTVAASGANGDGVTVRVVNHGNLSGLVTPRHAPDAGGLRLVSDPALPYDLGPGQAVVATLRVQAAPGTDGCPAGDAGAAAEALYLEAETPYGFSEVTRFPTAAIEAAVRAWIARTGCR